MFQLPFVNFFDNIKFPNRKLNLMLHTLALLPKGKKEFCFGDLEVRLGVRGRAVMVDVPEATILMGIAVDSKLN